MSKAQLNNMLAMCRYAGIGFWSTGHSNASRMACNKLQEFVRSLGIACEGNCAYCTDGVYVF